MPVESGIANCGQNAARYDGVCSDSIYCWKNVDVDHNYDYHNYVITDLLRAKQHNDVIVIL